MDGFDLAGFSGHAGVSWARFSGACGVCKVEPRFDLVLGGLEHRNWSFEHIDVSARGPYAMPVFKPAEDEIEPWLNLGNAAKLLKIAPRHSGWPLKPARSKAVHPLSDGPWIFARTSLITASAQSIAERARQNPRYPTGSHPNQQSLFSSTT